MRLGPKSTSARGQLSFLAASGPRAPIARQKSPLGSPRKVFEEHAYRDLWPALRLLLGSDAMDPVFCIAWLYPLQ